MKNMNRIGGLRADLRPPATDEGSREQAPYSHVKVSFVKVFLSKCDNFCHFLTIFVTFSGKRGKQRQAANSRRLLNTVPLSRGHGTKPVLWTSFWVLLTDIQELTVLDKMCFLFNLFMIAWSNHNDSMGCPQGSLVVYV